MAVNPKPPDSLSVEEQTALARANLDRRIAVHRQEVAQLRGQLGDPDEAWRRFVRETFDREALLATYAAYLDNPHEWLEEDAATNG